MGLFDSLFGNKKDSAQPCPAPIQQQSGSIFTQKAEITSIILDSLLKRYIAFDVETTGLSSFSDRIVELGAVVFENGQIISKYSTLVNPGCPIPLAASQVNHMAERLGTGTGLKVNQAEEPIASVALGLAKIIKEDNYKTVAYAIEGMSK